MKKILTTILGWYINLMAHIAPRHAARFGFKIFCRPFRAPMTSYHLQFLNSAEKFSFHHDGVRIQAYRWGHGPNNVLFLHGWQSHSFRWKAYIEAIDKEQFTIYAFDAPGHGLSGGNYINVPFYGEVIVQLVQTIGRIDTVVSHSFGSFSALYTMFQNPSLKINKMVLLAPPGEASDFVKVFRSVLGLSDKSMELIHAHFMSIFHHPITWFSTARFAANITIPGLIIHDRYDDETAYQYSEKIHDVWPNTSLVITDGLGHNLKSPEIVKRVTEFVEKKYTFTPVHTG